VTTNLKFGVRKNPLLLDKPGISPSFAKYGNNLIKKIKKSYRFISKVEFAEPFFPNKTIFKLFPDLKEVKINYFKQYDNSWEMSFPSIPKRVERVLFNYLFTFELEEDLIQFEEKFAKRLIAIPILFEDDELIDHLANFKKLEKLIIENSIELKSLILFSKNLDKLRYLKVENVNESTIQQIIENCRKFKNLKKFRCHYESQEFIWRSTDVSLKGNNDQSILKSINSIMKKDVFNFKLRGPPILTINYFEDGKICLANGMIDIDFLYSNKIFLNLKSLIIHYCCFPYDKTDRMVFYNFLHDSSITTLILEEECIKQVILDIFIKKAEENPKLVYIVANSNKLLARRFKVLDNLFVFLSRNSVKDKQIDYFYKNKY